MVSVTGSSAIKGELRESLTHFAPETVLRVSYITEDESYILGLVQDAYYSAPQAAFGLPSVAISLYPDSGYRRIVELELTYPDRVEVLQQKQRRLLDEASGLLAGLPADAQEVPLRLWTLVRRSAEYQPNGAQELGSAYAALVEGRADSEGLALAFKLLCDLTETESLVVVGTLNGERHVWNLIYTDEGWRHTSAVWEDPAFLTDSAMLALGYAWDTETTPAATAPGMEVNMETGEKST
ncbi:hypothetical protein SDC9_168504 [bioreactor metagenome]|uniref:Transglutaminase-like domain-containing protein n=1 Tax=bioreactor metagenome TaxID=1076179 RepID=A0A645G3A7_9ZZZZ